jgi:hypothetical protein
MKRLLNFAGLTLGFLCAVCPPVAGASTIYSSLGSPNGALILGPATGEIGDEVQAAGADRLVTELQLGIYPQNTPGSADFQARLYANDGLNGQPGTLLWQSGVLDFSFPGAASLLTFSIPDVAVPNLFTWTL